MYSQYLHQLTYVYNEKILRCLHSGESVARDIKFAQERREIYVKFWLGTFEVRDSETEERIILKRNCENWIICGVYSYQSRWVPKAGFRKYFDKILKRWVMYV